MLIPHDTSACTSLQVRALETEYRHRLPNIDSVALLACRKLAARLPLAHVVTYLQAGIVHGYVIWGN